MALELVTEGETGWGLLPQVRAGATLSRFARLRPLLRDGISVPALVPDETTAARPWRT